MKLRNLKTAAKLGLGFGIIIALTVIIAAIGVWGIFTYNQAAKRANYINFSDAYFINARLDAGTLAYLKQESYYQSAMANCDSTLKNIDSIIAIVPNGERMREANEMKAEIVNYTKLVEELKQLVMEDVKLSTDIKELGDKIEQSVGSSNVNLLTARKNYLYFKSYTDFNALNQAKESMAKIKATSTGELTILAETYINKVK